MTTYKITFDDDSVEEFKIHPIYTDYACNKNGNVINLKTMKMIGKINKGTGYVELSLGKDGKKKKMRCHVFIWQCYNDVYPKKNDKGQTLVVKHSDNIKHHNNISNLKLDTQSNNIKDAIRDGLIEAKGIRTNRKCIGINEEDEEFEFESLNEASRETNILPASIRYVCEGIYKSATSKTDGKKWTFKYA